MRLVYLSRFSTIRKSQLPLVIGYFSCIHVMHNELLSMFHEFNVLTFKDNDFKKEEQIYGFRDRIHNLSDYPINKCYVYDIIKSNITAEKFIQQYLRKIAPTVIIVGNDFKFGSDFKGINELRRYFTVEVVGYHTEVSTTKIAKYIKNNDLELANSFLIKPYYYRSRWIAGRKQGRLLGFETINLRIYRPPYINKGSYIARVHIGKKIYPAIAFYGTSETFNQIEPTIEAHIIGKKLPPRFIFPFYKKRNIKIEFLKYIRQNNKYTSPQLLKQQLEKDKQSAQKYFKDNNIEFNL